MSEKLKHYVLYFLIAASTIPFLFAVDSRASNSLVDLAFYGSAVLGYVGVAIILWQYILGTRSVTGLYFKDLAWTIKLHSNIGKWGTLLIFLHPLLILYVYGESLLYLVVPDFSSEFNTHVTFGRIALISLLVVWFTSAIVRSKIAYRPWKYVHYLAYIALPASFLHAPDIGSSFGNTAIKIYWYSFIAVFVIFTILRARHLFGFGKLQYEVVSNKQVADKVYLLKLKPQNKAIIANLGQYIYLQTKLIGEEHPFSVLKINQKTGELMVGYKVFGKFTQKLSKVKPGANLNVDGPYGVFTKEVNAPKNKSAVFIAGGIGVTPFVSYVLDSNYRQNKTLIYANQKQDTAAFDAVLQKKLKRQVC